jgi:hypothetical protein
MFVSVLPSVAAEPGAWGPVDNGLRISVTLGGKQDSREIRVTLKNVGEKDILIPLGVKVGNPHPILFNVFLKTANGESPRVIYNGLGVIAGVVEPLTMGLRASETYTLPLAIDRYYVSDASEKLATFIKRRCQLWVELDVKENQCPIPTTLDSLRRTLPCWYGKVVSNVLQLPN